MNEQEQTTTLLEEATIPEAMLMAVGVHRQGKMRTAVEVYRRMLALNPRHADLWYNLGNTLRKLGCIDQDLSFYRQAITLSPTHLTRISKRNYHETARHYRF